MSTIDKHKFIPDFIAVCEPLISGTLRKPALSPNKAPPGKAVLGRLPIKIEWKMNAIVLIDMAQLTHTRCILPKYVDVLTTSVSQFCYFALNGEI